MSYLDHAATTPMLPQARDALVAQLAQVGNPSSLHASGRRARQGVEQARESLAASLGVRPSEVVFTSGGTEADNLAVKGIFRARRDADPRRTRILATRVEHHAVGDSVAWLAAAEGAQIGWLDVDADGRVHPDTLAAELERDGGPGTVALVTVQWANNEVGTVQPVEALVEVAHSAGVPVHSDAVQAVGAIEADFAIADAVALSGHKLGGPPGVGALLLGRAVACAPLLHGGGQERDLRSGTLDAPSIVSFAVAVEHAVATRAARAVRLASLRDALERAILAEVPDAQCNGDRGDRLPGIAHLTFPGCEGDSLLMLLDAHGVECSTGSACSAGVARPSHVLLAMGRDEASARASLRFSLGHTSTEADVRAVAEVIGPVVERGRRAGLVARR